MSDDLPENVVVEEQYRIRRSDGYYSTGGQRPSWNKRGKVWKKLHHLRASAVRAHDNRMYGCYAEDCVIEKTTRLCIESTEDMCEFGDYLRQLQQEEDAKERERQKAYQEQEKKKRYEMYLKLKEEFENV